MKKINKSTYVEIKMPHIFREELIAIEDFIVKELGVQNFSIQIGDMEYESFNEIDEKELPKRAMSIKINSPYIEIDFLPSRATIYSSSSDINSLGAVSKIKSILKSSERDIRWFFFRKLPPALVGILSGVIFMSIYNLSNKKIRITSLIILAILSYLYLVGVYGSYTKNFSLIEFSFSKNKQSFFIRKKDEILLSIISIIFGGLITLLVTQLK